MIQIKLNSIADLENWHWKGFEKNHLPELDDLILKKRKEAKRFLLYIRKNIRTIILGQPKELEKITKECWTEFSLKKNSKKEKVTCPDTGVGKIYRDKLSFIFNYKKFCDNSNNGWNAYQLAELLDVATCPYCNRLPTNTIIDSSKTTEEDRRVIRPSFDHFLDKATYPFLAISLYNLVPSCDICNSRLKLSSTFSINTHIHPYVEGFGDDAKFSVKVKDVNYFYGHHRNSEINLHILDYLNPDRAKKISNSANIFRLRDIYREHRDYAQELVYKSMVYSDDYLDGLFKLLEGTQVKRKEDLIRFVTSNYTHEDELGFRPLAKLTRDISDQFELWK